MSHHPQHPRVWPSSMSPFIFITVFNEGCCQILQKSTEKFKTPKKDELSKNVMQNWTSKRQKWLENQCSRKSKLMLLALNEPVWACNVPPFISRRDFHQYPSSTLWRGERPLAEMQWTSFFSACGVSLFHHCRLSNGLSSLPQFKPEEL